MTGDIQEILWKRTLDLTLKTEEMGWGLGKDGGREVPVALKKS